VAPLKLHKSEQLMTALQKFFFSIGKWREIKSEQFNFYRHNSKAVLYAIDSAADVYDKTGKGGWVEAWNFSLTHKDKKHLYAYFIKNVINY
jgi:hypothetical protein